MITIDGKEYLRTSAINEYLDCGAKFYFDQIEKVKVPNKWHLAFGSSIHHALYVNMKQKIDTKIDLPTDAVQTAFAEKLEEEFYEVEKKDFEAMEEKPGQIKDDGVKLLEIYQNNVAPSLVPLLAEKTIKVNFKGQKYGLISTIDQYDVYNVLTDYKTTSRGIKENHQPYIRQVGGFYPLLLEASGRKVDQAHIHWLVRGKELEVKVRKIEMDKQYAINTFKNVAKAVDAGVFMPNRDSFLCTKRFCKFWDSCEKKFGGSVKP